MTLALRAPHGRPGRPRRRAARWGGGAAAAVVAAVLVALLAGLTGVWPRPPDSPGPSVAVGSLPAFSHVWLIAFENESYHEIVGSPDLPYLNGLIARSGLAEAYQAVTRPSQPNYLALVSGSTHGVDDNDDHEIDAPSLFDQVEASGRTWRVFAENVPPGCFRGHEARDGRDGPGTYARWHEPAISFASIANDPARCANITDLTAFDPAAADFSLIIPNLCHDMHDCPDAVGDAWLGQLVPRIIDSPAWRDGGILFITFDEGDKSDRGPGRVPLVVASPLVAPGFRSTVPHDHYALLRTIEAAWGLPCLVHACASGALEEFFARPAAG